jgi:hypothetical protein
MPHALYSLFLVTLQSIYFSNPCFSSGSSPGLPASDAFHIWGWCTVFHSSNTIGFQTLPKRYIFQAMKNRCLFNHSFRLNILLQDLHSMQSSSFHQTCYKILPYWHHNIPANTIQKVFCRIHISFDHLGRGILLKYQSRTWHQTWNFPSFPNKNIQFRDRSRETRSIQWRPRWLRTSVDRQGICILLRRRERMI